MNITVTTFHDKKKTSIFSSAGVILFIILWAMSFSPFLTPGLWQGLAVLVFCAGTYYGVKFHMTEYTYTLRENEFIIVKTVGKKNTKVCHLDNETVVDLYGISEWKKHKKERQLTAVYNYNAHALPEKYYVVVFELDSKKSAVMFEGSEEMYTAFADIIHGLKENQ